MTATFVTTGHVEPSYDIVITQDANGTITTSPSGKAKKGEEVIITMVGNQDYTPDYASLSVKEKNGAQTSVSIYEQNKFRMPAADGVITGPFVGKTYELTTQAENGILTLSTPRAAKSETITVTPKAATGYKLLEGSLKYYQKTDKTVEVSITGNTFSMPAFDVVVTAEFVSTRHNIVLTTAINGLLKSSPEGHAHEGETVTISGTGATGYALDIASIVVTKLGDPNTKVTVVNGAFSMPAFDVEVKGEFKKASSLHTVTIVNKTPDGGSITASPDKDVAKGATVTILETHNAGYELDKTKLVVYKKGDEATKVTVNLEALTFVMPDYDVVVEGAFVQLPTHTIELTASEYGILVANPSSARKGTTVTVEAKPSDETKFQLVPNSIVVTKKGDPNTKVPVTDNTFVMPDFDVFVYGEFEPKSYAVTVKAGIEHGRLTLAAPTAKFDETVTITVKSDEGYHLKPNSLVAYKKDNPSEKVEIFNRSFTMPAFDVEVAAEFVLADNFAVTLTLAAGSGRIEIEGYTTEQLKSVREGTKLTVKTTPDPGWKLISLKAGDDDILATKQFTVKGDVTVTAEFAKEKPEAVNEALFAGISLAPNPFGSELHILGNGLTGEYALLNVQGQVLRSGRLDAMETTLVTEALPAGLYLLRLSVEGATRTLRVVKE